MSTQLYAKDGFSLYSFYDGKERGMCVRITEANAGLYGRYVELPLQAAREIAFAIANHPHLRVRGTTDGERQQP